MWETPWHLYRKRERWLMAKVEPYVVCRDEAPRQDKTELQFPMAKLGIYGGFTVAFCCP